MLKKWPYSFRGDCQNIFQTHINRPLRFVILKKKRDKEAKFISSLERLLFSSKVCVSNNLLGPRELILLLPQYLPEHLVDAYILFLEFCHTRKYEKKRPKPFFPLERLPFSSKICVLNNLVGVRETILWFPQYLSEYLLELYKLSPEVCRTRKYENKEAKFFLSLERLLFFQEFVFSNNLLGVTEMILYFPK